MFISKDLCPVPFDQQPLNEYYELKKSCFFSWLCFKIRDYIQVLTNVIIFLFIFFIPLLISIDSHILFSIKFLTIDFLLVTLILVLVLVRLYLAWSYVTNRLLSATVFYEESGWYDGQIWIKTAEMLTKDRLVGIYEVLPLLKRLKYTLNLCLFFLVLESIVYYLI